MSLNYDFCGVNADYKDDAVWPITSALIWGTMSVGLNAITEKNWEEFYVRCHAIETINGAWLLDKDLKGRPITAEDVKSHVGLHTNADTRTKAEFQKDIYRRFVDQANRNIILELKTTEERENA